MTARRKPLRYPALPVVMGDDILRADHLQLTREGYTLERYLRVRINRRRATAECRAIWHKPAPADRPDVQVSFSHVWTIDLRKQVRPGE